MLITGKRAVWGGSTESFSIELPDDTLFLNKKGEIGDCLYNGYEHYLACTKTIFDTNSITFLTYELDDLIFISLNNIIPESEIKLTSGEEFYNYFNLGDYYIFKYTKPEYKVELDGLNIKSSLVKPRRLVSISRIISIESFYSISTFDVILSSWVNAVDLKVKTIEFSEGVQLSSLINNYFSVIEIKKKSNIELINAINEVLSYSNLGISVDVSDHPCIKQTDQ